MSLVLWMVFWLASFAFWMVNLVFWLMSLVLWCVLVSVLGFLVGIGIFLSWDCVHITLYLNIFITHKASRLHSLDQHCSKQPSHIIWGENFSQKISLSCDVFLMMTPVMRTEEPHWGWRWWYIITISGRTSWWRGLETVEQIINTTVPTTTHLVQQPLEPKPNNHLNQNQTTNWTTTTQLVQQPIEPQQKNSKANNWTSTTHLHS